MSDLSPLNLKMTSLDITSVYGKTTFPPLSQVPYHTMNFSDFGMKYLSPINLDLELQRMKTKSPLKSGINYLIEKLGYDVTIPNMYQMGLDLVASWGLIS